LEGVSADIAVRETWRGRVWRVHPMRVVEEGDGLTVAWHPQGIAVKRPFAEGRELRVPGELDWVLEDRPSSTAALALLRPGARYSLWLLWSNGRFSKWYVNFERDLVRTSVGFDVVDEKLDLVVTPDGRITVKDEDELREAARVGYLDEAEVRAELDRVLARPPWPSGWESFTPDPSWPTPALPDGWDTV
jgi:hypothetical protein